MLLGEPAIWTVPLSFATMIVVSLLTPAAVPKDVTAQLLTLHLPEWVRTPVSARQLIAPPVRPTLGEARSLQT